MAQDFWYPSRGAGTIRARRWDPEGAPSAVVQIVHGIAEHVERYDDFAQFLASQGFLVVAEDHMGHGKSVGEEGIQGYFHGGWFAAAEDSYRLLTDTRRDHPGIPYVLFGHSMGSFLTRTILCRHPDSGITAAILSGTGWQNATALAAALKVVEAVCEKEGETRPSPKLQKLVFGGYNRRVERPRTEYDWLSRDAKMVDAYIADPLCGFTPTAGLIRELMRGLRFVENAGNLAAMRKDLPVLFIAGGEDPVGSYGKGVLHTAEAFRKAGVQDVDIRIYPLCRHELLNEINRQEVYRDVQQWIEKQITEKK